MVDLQTQEKRKKEVIALSNQKEHPVYIYRANAFDADYIGKNITAFSTRAKLVWIETSKELAPPVNKNGTVKKNCKPKEEKSSQYYLELNECPEILKYMKEFECDCFGFVFEANGLTYQVFLAKQDIDNPYMFKLDKFRSKYAISKPMPIDMAIESLNHDILSLVDN